MENHVINIDNRQRMTISQVADIDNFNEETINAILEDGGLVIKVSNLHIQKLDLAEGKAIITGGIDSLAYTEKGSKQDKNFWKKILK